MRLGDVAEGALPREITVESGSWELRDEVLRGRAIESEREACVVLSSELLGGVGVREFRLALRASFSKDSSADAWLAVRLGSGARVHELVVRGDLSRKDAVAHDLLADGKRQSRTRSPYRGKPSLADTRELTLEVARSRLRLRIDGALALDAALAWDLVADRVALVVGRGAVEIEHLGVEDLDPEEVASLAVRYDPPRRVAIIAHRGASARAPENTLASIRLGIEEGADGVEFDVYRTRDQELVLFHDSTIARTTNAKEALPGRERSRIEDLSLEEVRSLDAGAWKSPQFVGEKIPTLEEALDALRGRATAVVEIKPDSIGREVAEAVRAANVVGEVFVQSFSDRAIREFRETLPDATTGWLTGDAVDPDPLVRARRHIEIARKAGANAIVFDHHLAHPIAIREAHRRALTVWVYTVNDIEMAKALVGLGIDGLITDRPRELIEALRPSGEDPEGGAQDRRSASASDEIRTGRVDLKAGEVPVASLLRFLSDRRGVAVIPVGDVAAADRVVHVVSDMNDVSADAIEALLEVHGMRVERRRLAGGDEILEASIAGQGPDGVRPRSIVVVGGPPDARRARSVRDGGARLVSPISEAMRAQLGVEAGQGVLVESTGRDALGAVLRSHDVILTLESHSIATADDLERVHRAWTGRAPLSVRVLRRGRVTHLRIER